MKVKMLVSKPEINIEKDKIYEIDEENPIVGNDSYKIKVPMKRAGKFKFALVRENEAELQ